MLLFRTLFVALLLLAPGLAVASGAQVSLVEAWVRALPPTQPNTAAYLTIENTGNAPIEVVAATASVAKRVEFHTTAEVDGLVRMQQLPKLLVGAGQALELAPGGTHLMLLGLEAMPQPGSSVQLCLLLASGDQACIEAAVRKDAGETDHQHHH